MAWALEHNLFLCPFMTTHFGLLGFFWLGLESSLFVLSWPLCWVLYFMEFARVSSFSVLYQNVVVVPKEVLVYVVVGKHFRTLELLPDQDAFKRVLKTVKICTGLATGRSNFMLFYGCFVRSL
jgi:hypothetical protein